MEPSITLSKINSLLTQLLMLLHQTLHLLHVVDNLNSVEMLQISVFFPRSLKITHMWLEDFLTFWSSSLTLWTNAMTRLQLTLKLKWKHLLHTSISKGTSILSKGSSCKLIKLLILLLHAKFTILVSSSLILNWKKRGTIHSMLTSEEQSLLPMISRPSILVLLMRRLKSIMISIKQQNQ